MFKTTAILRNYVFLLYAIVLVFNFPQWLQGFSIKANFEAFAIPLGTFVVSILMRGAIQNWSEYYIETPLSEFNADVKKANVSWLHLIRVAESYVWATVARAVTSLAFATGLLYWIVEYVSTKRVTLPINHAEVWVLPSIVGIGVVGWLAQFYCDVIAMLDTDEIVQDILGNVDKTLDKPSDEQE